MLVSRVMIMLYSSITACSKKDPQLLTKTVGCLAFLLSDENVNVTKRVMLACNSLYKVGLQVCVVNKTIKYALRYGLLCMWPCGSNSVCKT